MLLVLLPSSLPFAQNAKSECYTISHSSFRPLSWGYGFSCDKLRLECTNEDYELLRDFVLPRNGTLTRLLAIPRMKNMDILHPLYDHISLFEVRF